MKKLEKLSPDNSLSTFHDFLQIIDLCRLKFLWHPTSFCGSDQTKLVFLISIQLDVVLVADYLKMS